MSDDEAPAGTDRRGFLRAAALAPVLATTGCLRPFVVATPRDAPGRSLTVEQRRTLQAVQEHMLPSAPGTPGAREVNATGYLDAALATEDFAGDRDLVKRAASDLDRLAREAGAASFAALDEGGRERALRAYERAGGGAALERVLSFTLEALLGDPVHGGNPDGVGWAWAGHRPGSPRPPPDEGRPGRGPR